MVVVVLGPAAMMLAVCTNLKHIKTPLPCHTYFQEAPVFLFLSSSLRLLLFIVFASSLPFPFFPFRDAIARTTLPAFDHHVQPNFIGTPSSEKFLRRCMLFNFFEHVRGPLPRPL